MPDPCCGGPFKRGKPGKATNPNQQCIADCCNTCPPDYCCDSIVVDFKCGPSEPEYCKCECDTPTVGFSGIILRKKKKKKLPQIPTFSKSVLSANGFSFSESGTLPSIPSSSSSSSRDSSSSSESSSSSRDSSSSSEEECECPEGTIIQFTEACGFPVPEIQGAVINCSGGYTEYTWCETCDQFGMPRIKKTSTYFWSNSACSFIRVVDNDNFECPPEQPTTTPDPNTTTRDPNLPTTLPPGPCGGISGFCPNEDPISGLEVCCPCGWSYCQTSCSGGAYMCVPSESFCVDPSSEEDCPKTTTTTPEPDQFYLCVRESAGCGEGKGSCDETKCPQTNISPCVKITIQTQLPFSPENACVGAPEGWSSSCSPISDEECLCLYRCSENCTTKVWVSGKRKEEREPEDKPCPDGCASPGGIEDCRDGSAEDPEAPHPFEHACLCECPAGNCQGGWVLDVEESQGSCPENINEIDEFKDQCIKPDGSPGGAGDGTEKEYDCQSEQECIYKYEKIQCITLPLTATEEDVRSEAEKIAQEKIDEFKAACPDFSENEFTWSHEVTGQNCCDGTCQEQECPKKTCCCECEQDCNWECLNGEWVLEGDPLLNPVSGCDCEYYECETPDRQCSADGVKGTTNCKKHNRDSFCIKVEEYIEGFHEIVAGPTRNRCPGPCRPTTTPPPTTTPKPCSENEDCKYWYLVDENNEDCRQGPFSDILDAYSWKSEYERYSDNSCSYGEPEEEAGYCCDETCSPRPCATTSTTTTPPPTTSTTPEPSSSSSCSQDSDCRYWYMYAAEEGCGPIGPFGSRDEALKNQPPIESGCVYTDPSEVEGYCCDGLCSPKPCEECTGDSSCIVYYLYGSGTDCDPPVKGPYLTEGKAQAEANNSNSESCTYQVTPEVGGYCCDGKCSLDECPSSSSTTTSTTTTTKEPCQCPVEKWEETIELCDPDGGIKTVEAPAKVGEIKDEPCRGGYNIFEWCNECIDGKPKIRKYEAWRWNEEICRLVLVKSEEFSCEIESSSSSSDGGVPNLCEYFGWCDYGNGVCCPCEWYYCDGLCSPLPCDPDPEPSSTTEGSSSSEESSSSSEESSSSSEESSSSSCRPCNTIPVTLTTTGCCLYLGTDGVIEAVGKGTVTAEAEIPPGDDCGLLIILNGEFTETIEVEDGDTINLEIESDNGCFCCETNKDCKAKNTSMWVMKNTKGKGTIAINRQQINERLKDLAIKMARRKMGLR